MKKTALFLAALAAVLAAGAAQAQSVQQFQFPAQPGSVSPPSTLSITETPAPGATPPAAVRDTPESVRMYNQCREVSDRAAVSNDQMRAGVTRCLQELQARRQAQPQ